MKRLFATFSLLSLILPTIAFAQVGQFIPFLRSTYSTSTNATTTTFSTSKASTTALWLSGTGYSTANCLQVDVNGLVSGTGSACGAGGSSFGKTWELTTALNAIAPTSTVGIIVSASSTIGGGTNVSGLTVNGNSTTTNRLLVVTGSQTIGGPSLNGPFTAGGTGFGNAVFACSSCGSSGSNLLAIANYGTGNAGINTFSAQGTMASPSATLSGDSIYFMGGRGFGSTAWNTSSKAVIQMLAAEDFTDTANGTHITFETTPTGGTTRVERARIDSVGRLGIGTTTPQWLLNLASSTRPQISLSDGSLTSNAWTFRNAGGLFYFATASPSTFATSTKSAFSINANGFPAFPSLASCDTIDTDANGVFSCGTDDTGGGGASFGKTWELTTALDAIAPTSTVGIIVSASSTFAGNLNITGNATATRATSTTFFATIASSTNLFSASATIGTLIANAAATFTNGLTALISLIIPIGTAPTVTTAGQIAIDTTDASGQLLISTSTGATPSVIRPEVAISKFSLASTSQPYINSLFEIPTEKDGFSVTGISCWVSGGTSVAVNLSDGTNDTNAITCTTSKPASPSAITSNNIWTAGEDFRVELASKTGSVNYLSVSIFGYWTRE